MVDTMQALRAESPTSPLKLESVPVPTVGPKDVLIKIIITAITPGVVKMVRMQRTVCPCTVGHEAAGVITSTGAEVPRDAVLVGDRVRLHPTIYCGKCLKCMNKQDQICDESAIIGFADFENSKIYKEYYDGTAAEYIRAPYWLVDKLPSNVSFESATKVHDAATALHTLKLADIKHESTLVMTAPTGIMGVLTLRLAKFFPIKKIVLVGRSQERLEKIRHLTEVKTEIVVASNDEEAGPLIGRLNAAAPEGIDVCIDYSPSGGIANSILRSLKTGGSLVHMGGSQAPLSIPFIAMMVKGWKITGGRANTREDAAQILSWLESGELEMDDLITHRFEFSEVLKAIELLETRSEPCWLSVIQVAKQ